MAVSEFECFQSEGDTRRRPCDIAWEARGMAYGSLCIPSHGKDWPCSLAACKKCGLAETVVGGCFKEQWCDVTEQHRQRGRTQREVRVWQQRVLVAAGDVAFMHACHGCPAFATHHSTKPLRKEISLLHASLSTTRPAKQTSTQKSLKKNKKIKFRKRKKNFI